MTGSFRLGEASAVIPKTVGLNDGSINKSTDSVTASVSTTEGVILEDGVGESFVVGLDVGVLVVVGVGVVVMVALDSAVIIGSTTRLEPAIKSFFSLQKR